MPLLRRWIESVLLHERGFSATGVTATLRYLSSKSTRVYSDHKVIRTDFMAPGDPKPSHVYTCDRKPTRTELRYLLALCDERSATLTKDLLKRAGERYVRARLIDIGHYTQVTREAHLGSVFDGRGKNPIDLAATDKTTGIRYAISVKNQREWLNAVGSKKDQAEHTDDDQELVRVDDCEEHGHGGRVIDDALKRAKAHGLQPWLFVPFALDSAKARCKRGGVRLTTMGMQVVPATTPDHQRIEAVIARLRPVLGVQPYRILMARAERTNFEGHKTYEPRFGPTK